MSETAPTANVTVAEMVRRVRAMRNTTTVPVRVLRREFSRTLAKAKPTVVLDVARGLLASPGFTYRFIAYELVANHKPTLASLGEKELMELGRGMDSWEAVDTFGSYLSGPAWREHQIPDRVIHRWARSPDRWWRRAALVSTVALNGRSLGGQGDPRRTLAVCSILVGDRDDMVVKAMSWALRKLGDREPAAVGTFLSENDERLAARVVREVSNKLETGYKNPGKGGGDH